MGIRRTEQYSFNIDSMMARIWTGQAEYPKGHSKNEWSIYCANSNEHVSLSVLFLSHWLSTWHSSVVAIATWPVSIMFIVLLVFWSLLPIELQMFKMLIHLNDSVWNIFNDFKSPIIRQCWCQTFYVLFCCCRPFLCSIIVFFYLLRPPEMCVCSFCERDSPLSSAFFYSVLSDDFREFFVLWPFLLSSSISFPLNSLLWII